MQKKNNVILFLLFFFLLFSFPILTEAKSLEEIHKIKVITEDQVIFQDPEKMVFYDQDGKIKVGDYVDVFNYLKAKYGNQNNEYVGKTWSSVNKSGDYYDAIVFKQFIMSKRGFTGQISTKTAKDIALIPDSGLTTVYAVQDYITPFALLFAATYAVKAFADNSKKIRTKNQLLIEIIWMLIPVLIIGHMTDITKLFVSISNNTIEAVTNLISIFADGTDGAPVIGFDQAIDAAKRADLSSFLDSMGAMSTANFETIFASGFSTIAALIFLVIMYSGKLSLMIYFALVPIGIANLPEGKIESKGFDYFLSICAMILAPILNIVLMTMGLEMSTVLGSSNNAAGFFGVFVIPFATLLGLSQNKKIAKAIVNLAARKIRN